MKRQIIYLIAGCLAATIVFSSCKKEEPLTISSPNEKITFLLEQSNTGDDAKNQLTYKIMVNHADDTVEIVEPSPLGITRDDQSFAYNLSFESQSPVIEIKDSYKLVSGKQHKIDYTANEIYYIFSNKAGEQIKINVQVFNEGVAFRYIFPQETEETKTVTKEFTGFTLPDDGQAWLAPYDKAEFWSPAYETYFKNGIPIGENAPAKQGWSFPCLFNTLDHWIFISESNLQENYAGCHLNQEVKNGTYTIRFPEKDERYEEGDNHPSSTLPWIMPWRFILISKDIGDIVESNMVYHLSKPSVVEDTSWIEPGLASWGWWSSTGGRTVSRLKQYINLAANMNWQYSLVDAHWEEMPDGTIEEVIDYADTKDVDLWLWYNSGGRRGNTFERDAYIMATPELRKKEMKKLHDWGIKGIKVDFFNSDKQHVIKLYHDILNDAAKYQILVNFHGCTLPRGWRRTYPNLLSMEAYRGAESYRFDKNFPENAPWHNTIAVFTRNIIGPMDYTPCTFSDNKYPHKTTYGHELALSVVFESGIQHMADRATAFYKLPYKVQAFLQNLPATWDETRFITGYPGELAILARRKANVWYLAGINGLDVPMDEELDLSFLDANKEYKLKLIEDGDTPREFRISGGKTGHNQSIIVNMAPLGGFVAVLE